MIFDQKYAPPPRQFEPSSDYYPDSEDKTLSYCWRIYPCDCGKRTGWRKRLGRFLIPVCSDECVDKLPAPTEEDFAVTVDNYAYGEARLNE